METALTAAVWGGLVVVEPVLDVLPVPLILVEPVTARIIYANAAAHRLAGEVLRSTRNASPGCPMPRGAF